MHIRRGQPWGIVALCWSWAAVSAAATDPRPVTLPIVDGYDVWFARPAWESMSHTRVTEVVQDDLGFIWLGTLDGLRRYDGIRFKHYRPEPWHPNSLRGANIEALFKGSDGHLWISSDHFLDRFDPVAEVFTHHPSQPGGIEGQVYHISQDRAGAMWLATDHVRHTDQHHDAAPNRADRSAPAVLTPSRRRGLRPPRRAGHGGAVRADEFDAGARPIERDGLG
jgi:hypothetical protein